MSDLDYENKYDELMSNLQGMHKRNVQKTSAALKSLLIIPTIFLILLFMTNSSKTIFLVLWIASMFIIAAILIVTEYQDYSLRQMMSSIKNGEGESVKEASEEAEKDAAADEEITADDGASDDDEPEEAPEEFVTWSGNTANELAAWADEVSGTPDAEQEADKVSADS